jgi:outer membrane cobalamin receptor
MFLQDTPPVTESYITAPRAEQTVPRSAASTTVLSAEDLRRTGERTLPRMIAKAAGVGTFLQETNTGGGAPILRGLIGERVLIVVDGVRLNDGTTRTGPNQSLNTIDPAIVERVALHHIASYLGNTSVALSRIRRRIKDRRAPLPL